jgi:DNA-binding HxlR family transcriptional regulator
VRAGSYGLSLLSVPINVQIVTALKQGSRSLMELRQAVGSPPQTTLRAKLRTLCDGSIVERRRQDGFPGPVYYQLAPAGEELLDVARALGDWLSSAPTGASELGTDIAKQQVKALVGGWDIGVVRVLSATPLTLTQLSRLIPTVNYPSLERRIASMRLGGQLGVLPVGAKGKPYTVTRWLRHAVTPLSAACRWEQLYAPGPAEGPGPLDIEAALLLAVPGLRLDTAISGSCRLAVELGDRPPLSIAGVIAHVEKGRVVGCSSKVEEGASAWAAGPPLSWIQAVAGGSRDGLESGGDIRLVAALICGLHREHGRRSKIAGVPIS